MIERARDSRDWARIREICCETGNSGQSIERSRWPFFSEYWIGPYERLCPEWGYLVVGATGTEIVGYLVGCADSREFALRRTEDRKRLMADVAAGKYEQNEDVKRFLRRALGTERGPEESFPEDVRARLLEEYPAHLHMNLLEAARGSGGGRALVERFASDLRSQGVRGIHLFCGPDPVVFYERVGFSEVARIEFKPGVWVWAMGMRL